MLEMKKCSKCGEFKAPHMFYKDKTKKDLLSNWCKKCKKEYRAIYHEKNKERISQTNKKYKEKNKERISQTNKKYKEKNKEKEKRYIQKYTEENKEALILKDRKRIEMMSNYYIVKTLRQQGIPKDQIAPELIELKRAILKVKRAIKQKQANIST